MKIVLLDFHCHCSCNKHQFIVSTGNFSVLGHRGSQRHLLHSVVFYRRSREWSLLTTSGSPGSVWTKLHISYNHSTQLRQLMQALLCVDSSDHSNWTAKSLQQEKAGGGVPSKWRWEHGIYDAYPCKYCVLIGIDPVAVVILKPWKVHWTLVTLIYIPIYVVGRVHAIYKIILISSDTVSTWQVYIS